MTRWNKALKWSFLSEAASKAITPLVFLILARLLVPEDFGIFLAATMVVSFSQIFWEAGMSKALIQFGGDIESAASTAFWINLVLGLLVTSALLEFAEPIALHVFHDGRVTRVLQVMSIQVMLSALASIHLAILQRKMDFKQIFWIRLVTVSAPGMVSIPFAYYGMGYWALVAGMLVGQVFQLGILWKTCAWSPMIVFSKLQASKLFRFGGWVTITGLITWAYAWGDSLIVSFYLGSEYLGLYRVGQQLIALTFGLVIGSAIPVIYSRLCEIYRSDQGQRGVVLATTKILKIAVFVSISIGLLIMVFVPYADLLLGAQWTGIETVLSILVFGAVFSWVISPVVECFRAISKPHYETLIQALTLPVFIAAYLISIRHSFEAFLWVRIALIILIGVPAKLLFFILLQRRTLLGEAK